MELLQLKYFVEAARCENFSKTAAKFGVPPSDISQSIKRLERELGCELFERRPNSVVLTERAADFREGVVMALAELEDATKALGVGSSGRQIRILAASVRRIVMQAVENFKRQYPEVEIFVSYDGGDDPESFDLAVAGADFSHFGTQGDLLLEEEMVLAVNKSNPISQKKVITPSDVAAEAFISMGKESALSRMTEKIFLEAGINPGVSVRSDDPFYVRRCVELSLGMAIVPEVSWRGLFGDDVVLRPFTGAKRRIFLYVNERKRPSDYTRILADMLAEECESESLLSKSEQ
jgi:DNA-binding transcriptional LysR family regulator